MPTPSPRPALLALEDGLVFRGQAFGAPATRVGEVCFNTSMTGYQEILTDPSYAGQIITMTYPEIGNYGVNPLDVESDKAQVSGFAVRRLSPRASSWRSNQDLSSYLSEYGIPGISGIDTRALTKHLRTKGALRGVLTTEDVSEKEAIAQANAWRYEDQDFVELTSTKKTYEWDVDGSRSRKWTLVQGTRPEGARPLTGEDYFAPLPPVRHRIVAYDFGIKYNILRRLRQHGFAVTVVPARTPAEEVLAMKPAGVFLSNGPGDPSKLTYAHETARKLVASKIPVFGICLGHQILGYALGGKTFKLKFGHRGGNQPVQEVGGENTGRVSITSQNHGFAVDADSLPTETVAISQINLNDRTCEGLTHRKLPVFSVQYHPEASPGPHETTRFFDDFATAIETGKVPGVS
ncbi:carbamoyl-phosphate synthase small subunit [Verrucomicrobium sp. GAS474]|uniref:glutamine-hydrolyzing carbamoyl-phosphate synthase small subunit n=1 Tax=Verrucomicrobium sp. GAS474 TaxID=1882831 RepID=UPI00087D2031|nr:glutamine-hydrolyzing carbamoyl-phosphate synthase small subunit [Verrucomicrobium sp. GAS474]SDU28075.1 carbamoyl-phosphate synthase small subunit [Verrucomicrobium sp. GAS474]